MVSGQLNQFCNFHFSCTLFLHFCKCIILQLEFNFQQKSFGMKYFPLITASMVDVRVKILENNSLKANWKNKMDENEWQSLKILNIKSMENALVLNQNQAIDDDHKENDDNKYTSSHFRCRLMFEILHRNSYQMLIALNIKSPVFGEILSNIQTIHFGPIFHRQSEIEIALNVHSHKGHCQDYIPQNMLQSNEKYYLSADTTDDWIIFMPKDDQLLYGLTKVQVRTKGNGNRNSLRRFRILIGNANSDEWIVCNDEFFVADKMDNNLQTFDMQFTADKWNFILEKKRNHFKLEILDNYEGCYTVVKDFKLFGVTVRFMQT